MKHWVVCQRCGLVEARKNAKKKHWFISVHRIYGTPIENCPWCWSIRSMRNSRAGQTAKTLKRWEAAKKARQSMLRINPFLQPFPMVDEPPGRVKRRTAAQNLQVIPLEGAPDARR